MPVPAASRLAFIDLDGTLYRWSFYVDLIEQLMRFQQALPAHFFESQTHRRTWQEQSLNDDAYLSRYIHEWEARAIIGLAESELVMAAHEVLRKRKTRVYIFTRELLLILKQQGYRLIGIGGSPRPIVQELCREWKFDEWVGMDYHLNERRVYARNQASVKRIEEERGVLVNRYLEEGVRREGSIALGDTLQDWAVLRQVEYPLAFNPEHALHLKARQTGVPVIWERKNVIGVYRTHPAELAQRNDAFLFQEMPWKKVLPAEIAEPLSLCLRALDQMTTNG